MVLANQGDRVEVGAFGRLFVHGVDGVRTVIEQVAGRVGYAVEPGRGAQFTVTTSQLALTVKGTRFTVDSSGRLDRLEVDEGVVAARGRQTGSVLDATAGVRVEQALGALTRTQRPGARPAELPPAADQPALRVVGSLAARVVPALRAPVEPPTAAAAATTPNAGASGAPTAGAASGRAAVASPARAEAQGPADDATLPGGRSVGGRASAGGAGRSDAIRRSAITESGEGSSESAGERSRAATGNGGGSGGGRNR